MIILNRVGGGRIAFPYERFVCASTLITKYQQEDGSVDESNDEMRSLVTLAVGHTEALHLAVEHTLDDVLRKMKAH